MTPDVYQACIELEQYNDIIFQKKPDEGRMKGLAFVLDPDGYWIEVIHRNKESTLTIPNKYTLAQTMYRIKDPKKSLLFYCNVLGMTLIYEKHMSDFSLYFLATLTEEEKVAYAGIEPTSSEAADFVKNRFNPVIELTHNHGTENDDNFKLVYTYYTYTLYKHTNIRYTLTPYIL